MPDQRNLITDGSKHLITGAAGFIGSHLVDRLLGRGASVIGVDNMKLGRLGNLSHALENPRFRMVQMDVNDVATLSGIVAAESRRDQVKMVWHLAANSDIRAGVADPDVDLRDTFLTTHNLLKVLREHRILQIAFASTSAIYGEHSVALTEDTGPLLPISNYGAMKLASEAAISSALESFLERAWIFRFPNVVGGRATHGAIHDFVRKLLQNSGTLEVLGDGTQAKPYSHVGELIDAMLFIVDHARDRMNLFNIGTTKEVTTVRHIAESVVQHMSPKAVISYTGGDRGWVGDVPKVSYSVDKLRHLGYEASLSSDQAVEQAVREVVAEVRQLQ